MADVRALLLTDVVDSTRLSERLGDARMAALWAAHDRVARDLLRAHRGREIDKTDGFLLVFEEASDALAYAIAYHKALRDLSPPLSARAGLHVGAVILRENSAEDVARGAKPLEVEGVAKPTAARIMALAIGGQTLATAEAVDALGLHRVQGAGRDELVVSSHGHWQLKGLQQPIELFEVGPRGDARLTPPPDAAKAWRVRWLNDAWVPVRAIRHSLPAERDHFVGRQEDLAELARRLDDGARLVSVLGTGGMGKTRLAVRFGWAWLGSFAGGAWFCDLSEARSVEGIAAAVARGLDVPLGNADSVLQLGRAIAGRGHCLVILDNFEQVARHAHETLGHWLDHAPEAQFVVTTREVLGVAGEEALALAPLPPQDATALFIRRAESSKRGFDADPDDRRVIDALVQLLDRLPLAIELAAARVRVMPPKTLLARMNERFRLLASTGSRRDRQATLRATLDWSWDLLSEPERAALAQLSVFEGGFTLEAAEAVLDLTFDDAPWVADVIQALVDKSLVQPVHGERFDLLVTVQEYAAEQLGEATVATQARHGDHFAGLDGDPTATAPELENLIAACRRAATRGDAAMATRTLEGAWAILNARGPFAVGLELAGLVRDLPGLLPSEAAAVDRILGTALWMTGRVGEGAARCEAALEAARRTGERRLESLLLGTLGQICFERGRMREARAYHEQALVLRRALGQARGVTLALLRLGNLDREEGRVGDALARYEEALAGALATGDAVREVGIRTSLGTLHFHQGRPDAALAFYEQALASCRALGHRSDERAVLMNLGVLHAAGGRPDEARACHEAALRIARELGSPQDEAHSLGNLGTLLAGAGRLDEAEVLVTEALRRGRALGDRHFEGWVLGTLAAIARDRGQHARACELYEAAIVIQRELGERRHQGQFLVQLGAVHARAGRLEDARACFLTAEPLLDAIGAADDLIALQRARAEAERLGAG